MSKSETVKQLLQLLIEKRLWWMIPLIVVFLFVGVLLVASSGGSAFTPFIYALF